MAPKVRTQKVGDRWYATALGQAASGATEQEAIGNLAPLMRQRQKELRTEDAARSATYREQAARRDARTHRYRVRFSDGSTVEVEALSKSAAATKARVQRFGRGKPPPWGRPETSGTERLG